MGIYNNREQNWLYEVTGVDPSIEPYANNLEAVPKSWFYEKPDWWDNKVDQYSIWVDEQGRVAGLVANFDQCYLNIDTFCFKAPPVKDDEKFVYQGNVQSQEGDIVPVAILAATKGHSYSDRIIENVLANQGWVDSNFEPLKDSPDVMAHQLMYGRYVNFPEGIGFLGAIFPHVDKSMVQRINASAISGQWQYDQSESDYIFTGASFVNKGALPLKNKQNIQLRNIAASYGYNLIMGVDTSQESETCACQDLVSAAQDPTPPQAITGTEEVINEDITIDDVVFAHTGQIAALEKAVILLEKEVARLVAKDEEAV